MCQPVPPKWRPRHLGIRSLFFQRRWLRTACQVVLHLSKCPRLSSSKDLCHPLSLLAVQKLCEVLVWLYYTLSHLSKWGSWICTADFGQQLHIWQNELEIWEVHLQFTRNAFVRLPGRIIPLRDETKALFLRQSGAYQGDCLAYSRYCNL